MADEPAQSPENLARGALYTLAENSLKTIADAGEPLSKYSGRTAFFDPQADAKITARASFEPAAAALAALSSVQTLYGPVASKRLSIQFVYNTVKRVDEGMNINAAFEQTWQSFEAELAETDWKHVGIANLQNFHSDSEFMDLGDGVTIRERDFQKLGVLLGWGESQLKFLADDWQQGAFGSHVIVVEHRSAKTPDNFRMGNTAGPWEKAQRMLLALRLLKEGEITVGRMFYARPAQFNVGIGGMASTGFTVWRPGSEYRLDEPEVPAVHALYELLVRFETNWAERLSNLALALRRFTSIYDRLMFQRSDRLVDAVTAFEALLKIGTEISFRLAFRTAGIIAADDDERLELFEKMADYYEVRNKIVHGGSLEAKHRDVVNKEAELRNVLRQLLLGFLRLADANRVTKTFYRELDATLQHTEKRKNLRKSMGFDSPV